MNAEQKKIFRKIEKEKAKANPDRRKLVAWTASLIKHDDRWLPSMSAKGRGGSKGGRVSSYGKWNKDGFDPADERMPD